MEQLQAAVVMSRLHLTSVNMELGAVSGTVQKSMAVEPKEMDEVEDVIF